jgi:ribonucleases P/MRP protein subunit RPP40
VTKLFDESKSVDIVYLDLSKAFDKVPFKRLLFAVKKLGVNGKILQWLENWLTGRKQRVVLNGKFSDWLEVLSGIPQGSVLGPLLFIVFINELDDAAVIIDLISKFADDTKLCKAVQSDEDRQKLQDVLDNLNKWAEDTGMSFNVAKCKVLHVGNNNNRFDYRMNGSSLIKVESEKDLGVKYVNNLKPSDQCSEAAKTANFVLGQICRNFHYRDKEVFVNLYKRYVRVHLEYCTPAWNPWMAKDIAVLEKVQERAVKQIRGLQATLYSDRLKELNLPSLTERRHRSDMIETFKILKGFNKVDSTIWFQHINRAGIQTRNSSDDNNLVLKRCHTDIRKNFFSSRVITKWNELPSEVKNARTVKKFKEMYDKL